MFFFHPSAPALGHIGAGGTGERISMVRTWRTCSSKKPLKRMFLAWVFFTGDEPINIPGTCVCPVNFWSFNLPTKRPNIASLNRGPHLGSRYVYTLYGVIHILYTMALQMGNWGHFTTISGVKPLLLSHIGPTLYLYSIWLHVNILHTYIYIYYVQQD